jgi:hypothetical protein
MAGLEVSPVARESRKQKEKQDRKSKRSRRVAARYAAAEAQFYFLETQRRSRPLLDTKGSR